ncbi:MAG: M2 family metallopeptidase [Pyrinomonadaceae bacterium]|nr:M2 family metallopeptidase [Pyrinomonadaceae bacterium]
MEERSSYFKVCAVLLTIVLCFAVAANKRGTAEAADARAEAQKFIDDYTRRWNDLRTAYVLADWQSNTRIVEGDDANTRRTNLALERLAAFTGSRQNIDAARRFLQSRNQLTSLQTKQLERILYMAADNPETAKALVRERIAAETAQTKKLYGFNYILNGKPITTNGIDEILINSNDLQERRRAWLASKEVGVTLKDGLANLQRLRNGTVESLGFRSYNTYQVSDYGLTADEMIRLLDQFNRELRPLYRELHTYARYELARRYNQPVPDQLPADWLPNRWGQDWSGMINVKGMDVTAAIKNKSPEWVVKEAENFYISLGFPKLPQSFYDQSSLYPVPPNAGYKKNNHASAWHMDNREDVRSLMSVESNADWYETTHHELGHIYYYIAYSNPEVPLLLREGANRAYHEAIGTMMGLAATQRPFLEGRGLAPRDAQVDETQALLKEAMNYVVFNSFAGGTMPRFEYDLYERRLPKSEFNRRWWELTRQYQGIVPPVARGEEYCDACTKTHINDDAAQYYDYAIANILLFQLHDHIARNILKQDPRATNYYGNKAVGDFLRDIMRPGSSRDWRTVLKEKTGEDLSARAMLRYFEPLMAYLKQANKGRKYTLPELPTEQRRRT